MNIFCTFHLYWYPAWALMYTNSQIATVLSKHFYLLWWVRVSYLLLWMYQVQHNLKTFHLRCLTGLWLCLCIVLLIALKLPTAFSKLFKIFTKEPKIVKLFSICFIIGNVRMVIFAYPTLGRIRTWNMDILTTTIFWVPC